MPNADSFITRRQGTRLIPADWFRTLEQPCFSPFGCGKFADPAMIEVAAFQRALGLALGFNTTFPFKYGRYGRFENSVLGPNPTDEQKAELRRRVDAFVSAARHVSLAAAAGPLGGVRAAGVRQGPSAGALVEEQERKLVPSGGRHPARGHRERSASGDGLQEPDGGLGRGLPSGSSRFGEVRVS